MDLNSWASLPIRFNSQNSNNKDESTAQTARSILKSIPEENTSFMYKHNHLMPNLNYDTNFGV